MSVKESNLWLKVTVRAGVASVSRTKGSLDWKVEHKIRKLRDKHSGDDQWYIAGNVQDPAPVITIMNNLDKLLLEFIYLIKD